MDISKIPLSVYFIFLFALLIIGVKGRRRKEFHDNFLDLDITKGLQGFAAVAIMLHHLAQTVTNYGQIDKGAIVIMNNCGVLLTGLFFFFSGYGLYTSFMEKENYLKGFMKKRLPTVLIPFYTTNTIFIIISLIMGYKMKAEEAFLYVTGLVLLNSQMWYIVEIVFLYIAFFVSFRFIKKQKWAFTLMAVLMLVLTTISLLLGHDYKYASGGAWFKGEWWYNSTWLFFVGMLIARFKTNVIAFAKKYYAVLLPVGIILAVAMRIATTYMLAFLGYWKEYEGYPGYKEKFLTCTVETASIILVVLVFLLITMKLQFYNRALKFLGKIAIELYLIHNIFILYLRDAIKADFIYFMGVYVGGIILATCIHYLDRWLITKICRK